MNKPEVIKHLDSIFDEIILNTLDSDLKDLIRKGTYFAGGCFKSLTLNERVNDYDLYFFDEKKAKDFLERIKNSNNSMFATFDQNNFKVEAQTDNAVSFSLNGKKIQFITKFSGKPKNIVEKFDFYHAWNWYVPGTQDFMFADRAIADRKLIYNTDSPYPLSALKRMIKFLGTGMTIDDENLIKIVEGIKQHDLKDAKTLATQKAGMYMDKQKKEYVMKGTNDAIDMAFPVPPVPTHTLNKYPVAQNKVSLLKKILPW